MNFENLGAGSILIGEVRKDLSAVSIPPGKWFVIRATQPGPLALTHLAINLNLLLDKPIKTTNGWVIFEFQKSPKVGNVLSWSVFAGFNVPELGAFLVIDQTPRKLSSKEGLKAGTSWAHHVELTSGHMS